MSTFRRRLMGAGKKEPPKYLTFTALESGTFTITMNSGIGTGNYTYAAYSLDEGRTWTTANNVNSTVVTLTTPTVSAGDTVMWKGKGTRAIGSVNTNADNGVIFSSTCRFNAKGYLASICKENPGNETVARMRAYSNFFNRCTTLVDASELILPEFTSNGSAIFYGLFYGCTSLTAAPTLSSTTLSSQCYGYMFYGCSSLETLPSLPATTLANQCYEHMFRGCTSITAAPSNYLPATTATTSCYQFMFYGCTALVTAPSLPATTISSSCYSNMFNGCISLIVPPPVLPAETLLGSCYAYMFYGCTSLTTSPVLPALVLTNNSYQQMFRNTIVSWIKMLATDKSASNCMSNWVTNVPNVSTSIFVKHIDAQWTTTGNSGVPTNWKVIYYDPTDDKYYLDQQRNEECDKYGNYKAVEATTNPEAMAVIYAQGWSASPDYMTFSEASAVTDIGTYFRNAGLTHFMEFIHFTGVTTIKTNAFSGNNSLVSLCIPRNVTTIQNFGVSGGPLEYLYIPSSVTTIVGSANFSNTSNVRFELHVDDLDRYVMLDFGNQIFKGTTNNPDYYFYEGETLLNSAVVLETATKIGTYAFAGYNKISSITIPNSVLTIGERAFYNARYGFTSFIDIGNGVTSIGNQAFADVRSCPTLICRAMTAPTLGTNVFQTWGYNIPTAERKLIVPVGAVGYDTDQWKTVLQDQRGYQLIYSDEL